MNGNVPKWNCHKLVSFFSTEAEARWHGEHTCFEIFPHVKTIFTSTAAIFRRTFSFAKWKKHMINQGKQQKKVKKTHDQSRKTQKNGKKHMINPGKQQKMEKNI